MVGSERQNENDRSQDSQNAATVITRTSAELPASTRNVKSTKPRSFTRVLVVGTPAAGSTTACLRARGAASELGTLLREQPQASPLGKLVSSLGAARLKAAALRVSAAGAHQPQLDRKSVV